ncbi:DNA-packaging protein [Roseovarius aestuarii]|uniref:DNA-packaging protein n=1 Tax=Roseovarius aestuarii TaxID=475083 RepID=UPI001CBACD7E|nr:terminase family protein [Roseovarius aestuarii]
MALPYLFEFWALEHQLPPEGSWRSWIIMGGRGAGKTRAGAEWVRTQMEGARPLDPGPCRRMALVGETIDQVREVMIFGESGILACSPPDRRPEWQAFSAHDPEGLRGPQFDSAWVDELAKWRKSRETWDMLQFALRLGDDPRVCITTTPRNVGVLKELLDSPTTVVTSAPTEANRAFLAESFLDEVRARYSGTRLGRQELDGIMMEEAEGALWTSNLIEKIQIDEMPEVDRVVVAVDPPVTGKSSSDECGIVVVGACTQGPVQDWRAYVLADCSIGAASPNTWANAAINAMVEYGADRLVAEVNQGGDLVSSVIRQVDPMVPIKAVHASRGKVARAEPVAALYEQGRISHLKGLGELEDQMCAMTAQGFEGKGSPDRVDALVWALTELMIEPAAKWRRPQVRAI